MPSINVHFDGRAFVPDEPPAVPLAIPVGQTAQVTWPTTGDTPEQAPSLSANKPGRFADLAKLSRDLPGAPPTLSMDHDHPYSGE